MKKTIISIFLIFSIFSCKNEVKTDKEIHNENQELNDEHEHELSPLELDNGKKWIVVPEMMTYIKNIEKSLKDFDKAERKDYFQLANDIGESLSELTSNCTMTGKAHDELHKWLLPFIELSDQLDKTEKLEEQKLIIEEMNKSFITFNNYFK